MKFSYRIATQINPRHSSSQRYFEGRQSVSREPGFPLGSPGFRIFKPNRVKFGIENMPGLREAGNNHRDYGIEGKFRTG